MEEVKNEAPSPADEQKTEEVKTETANEKKDERVIRKADAFEWVYAIGNLVCLATVLLAMVFGVATLFSKTVNPVSAVNNIIALFSIRKGNVYPTLASVVMTGVYIAFLVIMIKSAVKSIKLFIKVAKKGDAQLKWNDLYLFYDEVKGVAEKAVIFAVLCYMLSGGELTVGTYFVISVFLVNYVLSTTLMFIERNKTTLKTKETVTDFIFYLIRTGVIIACACLAAKFLILPSGQDLAFGFRALFSGVSWSARIVHVLYDLIIKHVLDIVLAIFYMAILDTLFSDPGYSKLAQSTVNGVVKDRAKKLMIIAAVSAAAYCILLAVSGFNVQFDFAFFESWFYALKVQYLPAILIIGALFAVTFMPLENKSKSPAA